MRKMKNEFGTVVTVHQHIMTSNMWEYYVLEPVNKSGVANCLVMGFETEMGDVYLPELAPHTISQMARLTEVMPAVGWQWVD